MTIKLFDKLFFDSSVGLGDAFVMNGIVRHFASNCNKLYYPARGEFFETLKCLYQDEPNIEVWRFYSNEQEDFFVANNNLPRLRSPALVTSEIHRVGCKPERIQIHWPQQIYENFDIPFSYRYKNFKLPKDIPGQEELYNKLTEGETEYALVALHASDHPNGIPVDVEGIRQLQGKDPIKIIKIVAGQTENMLSYKLLIEKATEIHCIPSSFFNLVDSMVTDISAKCYFHDIRLNSLMKVNSRWNEHRWDIINYDIRY